MILVISVAVELLAFYKTSIYKRYFPEQDKRKEELNTFVGKLMLKLLGVFVVVMALLIVAVELIIKYKH